MNESNRSLKKDLKYWIDTNWGYENLGEYLFKHWGIFREFKGQKDPYNKYTNDQFLKLIVTKMEDIDFLKALVQELRKLNAMELGIYESKKKEHMKITEEKLKGLISKAIKESFQPQPIGTVKNPTGYKCVPEWMYNNILQRGFSAEFADKSNQHHAYGNGFYFLLNEPDLAWRRSYGNSVIKVVSEVFVYL